MLGYIWDFSDGRQKTGRVVNAVFRNPGSYEITLTVIDGDAGIRLQQDTDTIRVTVEDRVEACFAPTDVDPGSGCKLKMDASCSQGNIELYQWDVFDGYGNYRFTGSSITKDFGSCPMPATITLTVSSDSGESDSATQQVMINYQRTLTETQRTMIATTVEAAERGSTARLISNDGETLSLPAAGPHQVQLTTRAGMNSLVVYPIGPVAASGLVTLDFSSIGGLVAGSLRVLEGDVVALGPAKAVLGLTSPARLEYALR